MMQKAKLFKNGRSQAVRLPAAFRFATDEVYIRRAAESGDVILSTRTQTWDGFFQAVERADVPDDFLSTTDRSQTELDRDPFAGRRE